MKISQLLQPDVVTVSPETSLKEAAALLVEHEISGLPVCLPDGRVIGVVSEADILVKEQGFAHEPDGGLLDRLLDGAYGDGTRLDALTVGDAMTTPAVTVESTDSVATAARRMIEKRINRLPVVDRSTLVGIVTRADLVRAFVRSDAEIELEIREDVLLATLWVAPQALDIDVDDGVVTLRGCVETKTTANAILAYVHRVPGVVAVHDELTWASDDLARRRGRRSRQLQR